ncbi:MAG: DUF5320 domain-containing protein [Desulfobacteraceae bacterium]|nr:DUF5320 domain-containing protein [Desulfobacteraceae bacterium]
MPKGDGTGPMGNGPMSGKGFGICAGYGTGRSFGFSFGRGLCNRVRMFASPNQNVEKAFLQEEADVLQTRLNSVRKRLDEMGKAE